MGILEDLIAVFLSTGEQITFRVFWVVFLVALPFAFISEYVVDHPRFWKVVLRLKDIPREVEEEIKKVEGEVKRVEDRMMSSRDNSGGEMPKV